MVRGLVFSAVLVGMAFGLAFWLYLKISKEYIRSLLADPSAPAYGFLFHKRWQYANLAAPLLVFLLWSAILVASLFA